MIVQCRRGNEIADEKAWDRFRFGIVSRPHAKAVQAVLYSPRVTGYLNAVPCKRCRLSFVKQDALNRSLYWTFSGSLTSGLLEELS